MKTNVKTAVIVIAAFAAGAANVNAESAHESKKHEIRPFYGTGYTASDSDIFADTLTNGLLGIAQRSETTTFGVAGLGYRYHIDRFGLGVDLGYSTAKEELFKKSKDVEPFETSKMKRYFFMPTASYSWYRTHYIDFYGSASAGTIYETTRKDTADAKTESETIFAYQINPIGLRIGNETAGGFLELGYGQKGILSAGISIRL